MDITVLPLSNHGGNIHHFRCILTPGSTQGQRRYQGLETDGRDLRTKIPRELEQQHELEARD